MIYTQAELHEEMRYDPETGQFWWKKQGKTKRRQLEKPIGTLAHNGYLTVRLKDYKCYGLHRIAFLYMTGSMPTEWVDHINGERSDNRWCNLRAATSSENKQNLAPTKLMGAFKRGGNKWYSSITVNGVTHKLGSFNSAEEAHAAYLAAKEIYHTFQPTPR